jgi:hypothetical protein
LTVIDPSEFFLTAPFAEPSPTRIRIIVPLPSLAHTLNKRDLDVVSPPPNPQSLGVMNRVEVDNSPFCTNGNLVLAGLVTCKEPGLALGAGVVELKNWVKVDIQQA